ncbi:hypothetical protein LCGC14_1376080 [marine sediment metagenome]|uniref:Uncharacterized protein n=1 Tax=marine sediment metagenome TaxID=412755 RepID=A0A0F9KPZ9_9ZZZZ
MQILKFPIICMLSIVISNSLPYLEEIAETGSSKSAVLTLSPREFVKEMLFADKSQ